MARSSFFFSCSTLVLPLLVLSCPVLSSSICRRSALYTEVEALGYQVKNCSNICPVLVTSPPRDICDCFNVSMPSTKGSAFNYFIEALDSTHSTIRSHDLVENLRWRLEDCSKLNISVMVTYEPVLSPVRLHEKLKFLSEQVNSNESLPSQ